VAKKLIQGKYEKAIKLLTDSNKRAHNALCQVAGEIVQKEITAGAKDNIIDTFRGLESLENLDWVNTVEGAAEKMPLTVSVFRGALETRYVDLFKNISKKLCGMLLFYFLAIVSLSYPSLVCF
jgi:hypothetical protein